MKRPLFFITNLLFGFTSCDPAEWLHGSNETWFFKNTTDVVLKVYEKDYKGHILEELNTDKYFVAALTPRVGVELFRHFRVGTVGPTISVTFGGGKKE